MQESTPKNPIKTKETDKTYAFRFVLSLLFGGIFVGFLMYLVCENILFLVDRNSVSYYDGETLADAIVALAVFGGLHLWLNYSLKKYANEPAKKYENILSIIYSSGWALAGLIIAIIGLSSLMKILLSVSSREDLVAQLIMTVAVIIIAAVVIIEQMRLIPKFPKLFYTLFMSILSAITIVSTLIFPGAIARDKSYDQQLVNDLYDAEAAIEDYAEELDKLPATLSALGGNYDEKSYSYEKLNETDYKLCADFKTDTTNDFSHYATSNFGNHTSGHVCFERSVYLYDAKFLPIVRDDIDDSRNLD